MIRPLVLGAAGQLGSELARLLPASGRTHSQLSIDDENALVAAFNDERPTVVFNCVAYNAVDRAETEKDRAFGANAEGPLYVAKLCRRFDSRMIHFSTNFVFDGTLDRPYIESDAPSPVSVYGDSKLQGEQNVLDALPNALVIRTSALYGHKGADAQGGSFPLRILSHAKSGGPLRIVADQKVNPTYAGELAVKAIELAGGNLTGVAHVVSAGCTGWDEFARAVLQECGVSVPVESISSAEYPSAARRPRNGCLSSTRVSPLRPWREGLRDWARKWAKTP